MIDDIINNKKKRRRPIADVSVGDLVDTEQDTPAGTVPLYNNKGKRSLFVAPEKPNKEVYYDEEDHQTRQDKLRGLSNAQALATGLQALFDSTQINNRNFEPLTQAPAQGVVGTLQQIAQNKQFKEQGLQAYNQDMASYNSQMADAYNRSASMDVDRQIQALDRYYKKQVESVKNESDKARIQEQHRNLRAIMRTGGIDEARRYADMTGIDFPEPSEMTGEGNVANNGIAQAGKEMIVNQLRDPNAQHYNPATGDPMTPTAQLWASGDEDTRAILAKQVYNDTSIDLTRQYQTALQSGDQQLQQQAERQLQRHLTRGGFDQEEVQKTIQQLRSSFSGGSGTDSTGTPKGKQQGQQSANKANTSTSNSDAGSKNPGQRPDVTINPTEFTFPPNMPDNERKRLQYMDNVAHRKKEEMEIAKAQGRDLAARSAQRRVEQIEREIENIYKKYETQP